MRKWELAAFGLDNLRLVEAEAPEPGPGELRLAVRALSLNFRDLAVVRGIYDPRLPLPMTPLSDAAGVVDAVGPGVDRGRVGERVMTHFVSGWIDGPYRGEYRRTTLGGPGPGVAAERVVLPAHAVVPLPRGYDFAEGATLPIAGLTAWSALVTEGGLERGQTILTLGTGGVSVFVVQIAKAIGARVLVTSRSEAKLARVRALGADEGIDTSREPDWERRVFELTAKRGADIVVETVGAATFDRSLRATRPGGLVALLGSVGGLAAEVNLARIFMNRIRVQGILVDSRAAFERLVRFVEERDLHPVIDRRFAFDELAEALRTLAEARHFGKIVVEVAEEGQAHISN